LVRSESIPSGKCRHNETGEYKKQFADPKLNCLFVALFDVSDWGMYGRLTPPQMAFLQYVERKVI